LYYLLSEIKALYAKHYYGQVGPEVDKALTKKLTVSLSYKYGNENPKYSTVNTLQAGVQLKY